MRQTGVYAWLFQRISGMVLFILIPVHFVLTHYMGMEKRMYTQVVQRLGNPLWQTFDLLILSLALFHGLSGLWGIAGDYLTRDAWRIACFVALVTLGAVLLILGIVTVLSVRAV